MVILKWAVNEQRFCGQFHGYLTSCMFVFVCLYVCEKHAINFQRQDNQNYFAFPHNKPYTKRLEVKLSVNSCIETERKLNWNQMPNRIKWAIWPQQMWFKDKKTQSHRVCCCRRCFIFSFRCLPLVVSVFSVCRIQRGCPIEIHLNCILLGVLSSTFERSFNSTMWYWF